MVATVRATGHLLSVVRGIVLLAQLQGLQGRLRQSASTYRQVLEVAPGPDDLAVLVGSPGYYFGMADLLREWNDLEGAERLIAQGFELSEGRLAVFADVTLLGYSTLARLRQARGDYLGAVEAMAELGRIAHERGFARWVIDRGAAVEAELAVGRDDLAAAGRWADLSGLTTADEPSFPREREHLALVRVRIAQGCARPPSHPSDAPIDHPLVEAIGLLDRLLAAAGDKGRTGSAVEIDVLKALALQAQGDREGAQDYLLRAVTLAEPAGYVRTFVDKGAPLRRSARGT